MAPAAAAAMAAAQIIQRRIAFSLARQRVYLFGEAMRYVASEVVYIHDPFERSRRHEMRVRANADCCCAGRAHGTGTALSVQTYPPHRALRGGRHFRHPGQTDR